MSVNTKQFPSLDDVTNLANDFKLIGKINKNLGRDFEYYLPTVEYLKNTRTSKVPEPAVVTVFNDARKFANKYNMEHADEIKQMRQTLASKSVVVQTPAADSTIKKTDTKAKKQISQGQENAVNRPTAQPAPAKKQISQGQENAVNQPAPAKKSSKKKVKAADAASTPSTTAVAKTREVKKSEPFAPHPKMTSPTEMANKPAPTGFLALISSFFAWLLSLFAKK